MEIEAVDEGILGRIVVPEGTENVKVNELIGLLLEEGEDSSALDEVSIKKPPILAPAAPSAKPALATVSELPSSSGGQNRVFATPLAKRIAEQKQIDLGTLSGSGPRGRIIRDDVEAYGNTAIRQAPLPEVKAADELFPSYQEIRLTNVYLNRRKWFRIST